MGMKFFKQPIGLLNIDYLLERAGVRYDGLADLLWPAGLWDRVVEDADERGIGPEQMLLHIVSQYYARMPVRGEVYDDDDE